MAPGASTGALLHRLLHRLSPSAPARCDGAPPAPTAASELEGKVEEQAAAAEAHSAQLQQLSAEHSTQLQQAAALLEAQAREKFETAVAHERVIAREAQEQAVLAERLVSGTSPLPPPRPPSLPPPASTPLPHSSRPIPHSSLRPPLLSPPSSPPPLPLPSPPPLPPSPFPLPLASRPAQPRHLTALPGVSLRPQAARARRRRAHTRPGAYCILDAELSDVIVFAAPRSTPAAARARAPPLLRSNTLNFMALQIRVGA